MTKKSFFLCMDSCAQRHSYHSSSTTTTTNSSLPPTLDSALFLPHTKTSNFKTKKSKHFLSVPLQATKVQSLFVGV